MGNFVSGVSFFITKIHGIKIPGEAWDSNSLQPNEGV